MAAGTTKHLLMVFDDRERIGGTGEQIPRIVIVVDRLDQQGEASFGERGSGVAKIIDHRLMNERGVSCGRRHADQTVQAWAMERDGVVDRGDDGLAVFVDAVGQAGEAAIAARRVPRREIVQHQFEPVRAERLGDQRFVVRIGELNFDGRETFAGSGCNTVEKLKLGK